jgi:ApbE superfamily uncharacterized protein (UPF0280 family)
MLDSAVKSKEHAIKQIVSPDQYRGFVRPGDLVSSTVVVKQTNLLVSGFSDLGKEARRLVHKYRREIEDYIKKRPYFETSLVPIKADPAAPRIVKTMIEAAARTGVGPMASVAGAIAEYVGIGLLQRSRDVIVENGGDIFICSAVKRQILLLAETAELSAIRIALPPSPEPVGLCTSSGTLGHSLSFGRADAVTVLWSSAALADAAATAITNVVKDYRDIHKAIRMAQEIGVHGVIILVGGHIGVWGTITFGDS